MDPSHVWEKPWHPCPDPTCHLFDPPKSTGVTMFQAFYKGDISQKATKKGEGEQQQGFLSCTMLFFSLDFVSFKILEGVWPSHEAENSSVLRVKIWSHSFFAISHFQYIIFQ